MSELWWCTVCQRETRFSTFETNGFSWLCCRRCGDGSWVPQDITAGLSAVKIDRKTPRECQETAGGTPETPTEEAS